MNTPKFDSQDQYQLVAHIAKSVGSNYSLGKKGFQKLVYLISELASVPTGYKFSFYTYGPYSRDLEGDLDIVKNMGFVEVDYLAGINAYQIKPGSEISKILDPKRSKFSEHIGSIDKVLSKYGSFTARHLELLSTIIFVQRNESNSSMSEDQVIARVKELKPKYDVTEIRRGLGEI